MLKRLELLIFAWIHGFFVRFAEKLGYIGVISAILTLVAFLDWTFLTNLIRRAFKEKINAFLNDLLEMLICLCNKKKYSY